MQVSLINWSRMPGGLLTSSPRLKPGDSGRPMTRPIYRVVHSSTGRAFPGHAPETSYSPSLRSQGLPSPQNVPCRILVAIMAGLALGASPSPGFQRQVFSNKSTARAPLARWEETITEKQLLAVPGALVLKHSTKGSEACVADVLGDLVIPDHSSNIQVLDGNAIESTNQVGGHLVKVVLPAVGNLRLNAGHLQALSFPSTAAFLPSTHNALLLGKFPLELPGESRVRNSFAIGECSQSINTEVNANTFSGFGQRFDFFVQNQRYEVPIGGVLGYRHRGRFTGEGSGPFDFEPAKAGNCEVSIGCIPLESASSILGALPSLFALELWVSSSFRKEVPVSRLQVPQRLLLRNARRLEEPLKPLSALELGEFSRRLAIGDRRPVGIGIDSHAKCPVVDEARRTEDASKNAFLLVFGVKSEPTPKLHRVIIYNVNQLAKKGGGARFPPYR